MNILIVGNGGRECALANSLMLSKQVMRVVLSEPNPGVYDPHHESSFRQVLEGKYSARFRSLRIPWTKRDDLVAAALREEVEYVLFGPEAPLAEGVTECFEKAGLKVIGPNKKAAKLEASKEFAKKFMKKFEIPTAEWKVFTAKEVEKAEEYAKSIGFPVAVKADGLCAGKGVSVCSDAKSTKAALELMLVKEAFGAAGKRVIVEKGLAGKEISFIGLFDGETYVPFPPATDYKRLRDGDKGPNTGGMGSIAPSPFVTPELKKEFEENILSRFIEGCRAEELDYCGFIYFGCMATDGGLKLLEFNVRMGDPEAQAILPLLRSDLSRLIELCTIRRLVRARPSWSNEHACTVILADDKYPDKKSEPQPIFGLDKIPELNDRFRSETPSEDETTLMMHPFRMPPVSIFCAGVTVGDTIKEHAAIGHRTLYASGGRVLAITARGATASAARKLAYDAVSNIKFKGMQYRTDIGKLKQSV
jgi:phosphoribosylamine--glycine ligase